MSWYFPYADLECTLYNIIFRLDNSHHEEALGFSGKEKLYFERQKPAHGRQPSAETSWVKGQEKRVEDTDRDRQTGRKTGGGEDAQQEYQLY